MVSSAAGPLDPLTPGEVSRAARLFMVGAAVGIDCWTPRPSASLPGSAAGARGDLRSQCERSICLLYTSDAADDTPCVDL
eukprot:8121183-Pyramimonas_sp.AAC.1